MIAKHFLEKGRKVKTLNDYLDLCKQKKELKNDADLARYLGMARASLSIIRSGGGVSQETAEKIAQGAHVALADVWMASLIQKEQNPRFKAILEDVTKRAGIAASLALLVVNLMVNFQSCILCKIIARWLFGTIRAVFSSRFYMESKLWRKRKATSITSVGTALA